MSGKAPQAVSTFMAGGRLGFNKNKEPRCQTSCGGRIIEKAYLLSGNLYNHAYKYARTTDIKTAKLKN